MIRRRTKANARISCSDDVQTELRLQLRAFRRRFGRDPSPADPVFFDPSSGFTLARALDLDELERDMIRVMYRARIAPELMYAYLRTGLMVTQENQQYLSAKDRDDWNRAIVEYARQLRGNRR